MKKEYSIEELFDKIKVTKSVDALEIIDNYAKELNLVITRVWSPKLPGIPELVQVWVKDDFYVFKYHTFFCFSWWSLHKTLH